MCRRVVAVIVAVALAACTGSSTARADSVTILLPSVRTTLTPGPPLPGTGTPAETLFPPGMTSDERVLVGIDATGKPTSIDVVQRLQLRKLGDYSFAIPGPIADVEAAAGSESEPGLRRDAILWAGFSSGNKTLAARATLRVAPASAVLPLRLTLSREDGALVVRGRNTSAARGPVLVGPVSSREAAKAFGDTLRWLPLRRAAPDLYATVPHPPLSRSEAIAAPLAVHGGIGSRHFDYLLADGRPMAFELRVPNAPPRARLRVLATPVAPLRSLAPPGGGTWAEALRRGRIRNTGLLERLSRARLAVAREFQYQTFLANPNPTGGSTAVYIYETTVKAATSPPSASKASGGHAWRAVLVAALAAVAATGLVVLWAYS
jgi:hypothetical protein